MTIPNFTETPPVWTEDQLSVQAQQSLLSFVDRRLKEPKDRYVEHLTARYDAITKVFRILSAVDPDDPDPAVIRPILLDKDLYGALRYMAGPPVSSDDLSVLVFRSTERLTKSKIKNDPEIPGRVLKMVCQLADPVRFPWLDERREPKPHEVKLAIRSTVAMHAAQTLLTERRAFGKEVERTLEKHLVDLGFDKRSAPAKITMPKDYPPAKSFYGECTIYGRKCDLLIGLDDGRIVAIEAKDSSSVLNSVKRVLNDTAAKAKHWHGKAGEQIVPVALLSGVFGLDNLKSAQENGLYIIWSHDLGTLTDWIAAQA